MLDLLLSAIRLATVRHTIHGVHAAHRVGFSVPISAGNALRFGSGWSSGSGGGGGGGGSGGDRHTTSSTFIVSGAAIGAGASTTSGSDVAANHVLTTAGASGAWSMCCKLEKF